MKMAMPKFQVRGRLHQYLPITVQGTVRNYHAVLGRSGSGGPAHALAYDQGMNLDKILWKKSVCVYKMCSVQVDMATRECRSERTDVAARLKIVPYLTQPMSLVCAPAP